jgi:hypothetical protein
MRLTVMADDLWWTLNQSFILLPCYVAPDDLPSCPGLSSQSARYQIAT